MAFFGEVQNPVWIALIVIIFSLVYKLTLYLLSPWYRQEYMPRNISNTPVAVLPGTMNAIYNYYNGQPNVHSSATMKLNIPNPLRYVGIYVIAIVACVFLLYGMNCSFSGNCETYAWIYVGFVAIMFTILISRMMYDYAAYKQDDN
jgi:hypothetical protein